MYPIPTTEKLIETKICKHCGISFPITDKDIEFYGKVSPIFGGKKYLIPPPTLCPDCRQQRRLAFRNERKLYKRKCDATGRDIISIYSPDKPYTVYNQEYWWSDAWDPMSYGREFDFSRGAMEQMDELIRNVPKMSISVEKQENSEYTNYAGWNKDCYLLFL
jgi:Zn ribbon nucleic-acid-binding protein